MDLQRKAALYSLYAACETNQPVCAAEGPVWDQSTDAEQAAMCSRCPVKKQCKAYAETGPMDTWGIWGGQKYPRTAKGKISKADPGQGE